MKRYTVLAVCSVCFCGEGEPTQTLRADGALSQDGRAMTLPDAPTADGAMDATVQDSSVSSDGLADAADIEASPDGGLYCAPETLACNSMFYVMKCSADGSQWEYFTTCEEGYECAGEGICVSLMIDSIEEAPTPSDNDPLIGGCQTCSPRVISYHVDETSFDVGNCGGVVGVVNPLAAVEEAITVWNNGSALALQGRVNFVSGEPGGEGTDVTISCGNATAMCGTAVIGCTDSIQILIQHDYPFTWGALVNTIAHELGHVIGLGHSNSPCSGSPQPSCPLHDIMCCYLQNVTELSCGDELFFFTTCGECDACCGCVPLETASCLSPSSRQVCLSDGCGCRLCEEEICQGGGTCSSGLCSVDDPCAEVVCNLPHTESASCVGGLCIVVSCVVGWNDCNNLPLDGCETAGPCGSCPECQSWNGSTCVPVANGIPCTANSDPCTTEVCSNGLCASVLIPNDCGNCVCGNSPSGCYFCGSCPSGQCTNDCLSCVSWNGSGAEGECASGAVETQSCDPTSNENDYCTYSQSRTCDSSGAWGWWSGCLGDPAYPQYGFNSEPQCGNTICITITEIDFDDVVHGVISGTGGPFQSTDAYWWIETSNGTIVAEVGACQSYAGWPTIPFSFPISALNLGPLNYQSVRVVFWGGNDCYYNPAYNSEWTEFERCF